MPPLPPGGAAYRSPLECLPVDGFLLPSRLKTVVSSTVTLDRSLDGVTSPSSLTEMSFGFQFNRRLVNSAGFPNGVVVANISFRHTYLLTRNFFWGDLAFPPRELDLRAAAVQQGPPGGGAPRQG